MVNSLVEIIDKKTSSSHLLTQQRSAQGLVQQSEASALSLGQTMSADNSRDGASTAQGDNYFLQLAKPLLTLLGKVKHATQMPDVDQLHKQIVNEVNIYINDLENLKLSTYLIDCSAYCICAAIDEAILSTEWGTQSLWIQKSLLSLFRSETLGGERFYIITESLSEEPRKHIHVLELIYILISLGFEGQYFGELSSKRDIIRSNLYQLIYQIRGKNIKQLSSSFLDEKTLAERKNKRSILKRYLLIGLGILICIYGFYSNAIYQSDKENMQKLQGIGHESPITAYSQLIDRELFSNKMK